MCGIFGIANHVDAARLTKLGLFALQHRGQQSTGMASELTFYTGLGKVSTVFTDEVMEKMLGTVFIGHNRYPTAGDGSKKNTQPLVMKTKYGTVKLGHNGNLTNAVSLRQNLEAKGRKFTTTADSEVILHLIDVSVEPEFSDALMEALSKVEGAYSLVILFNDVLIGVRDPLGFRPLVLGKLGNSWVLASETCAFDVIGAEYEREIEPGEAIWIKGESMTPIRFASSSRTAKCIFEHVYFSRPDSRVFDSTVLRNHSEHRKRYEMGRILYGETWKACGFTADIVVGIPDSGLDAAQGFADASGIPLARGFVRNHQIVDRTFIDPNKDQRRQLVRLKLNPIRDVLSGKRVILIDDSIVRGTTSQEIVQMVTEAGALKDEIHMRASSPPQLNSCFYGIDTPTQHELIAWIMKGDIKAIGKFLGVRTLGFLSLQGLRKAVEAKPNEYCDGCFIDNYPTRLLDLKQSLLTK